MDNTNFIINDFDGFGIEDEGSDVLKWDTWDTVYRDEKNTQTEMEYGNMMEEPRPNVNYIGRLDKYIGVKVKQEDGTNSGGNIATVKRHATDAN